MLEQWKLVVGPQEQAALSQASLRVRYGQGKFADEREYPALDELRPLNLLGADLPELFTYTGNGNIVPPPERYLPRYQVQAATVLRQVYGANPFLEEWVAFWREHFSIYAYDTGVGAFLPHWDRTVIREHCLGNFASLLEASAQHPSMLYYLNNRSSRAGSANENYARELFELHTLGRAAYLNTLYSHWRKVPGALVADPTAYIDEDVYEAARAFTGWTVEDGTSLGGGQSLPKTGRFAYVESWHDNYQKRVLAQELTPYAGPMSDGKKVLLICAYHRATAQHLATKLVKRFVSQTAPTDMVASTARVFYEQRRSPTQLSQVLEHLRQCAARLPFAQRQQIRRPASLVAAFAKAVNLPMSLGEGNILYRIEIAGPPIYGWPSPEGPPVMSDWYLSSSYLRSRSELLLGLAENWWGTGEWNPFDQVPERATNIELLARWERALFGSPRPELSAAILTALKLRPQDSTTDVKRARRLVGLLALSPSFQTEAVLPIASDAALVPAKVTSPKKRRAQS